MRTTMLKLQNLSEQLEPLEVAYTDVRFHDVDVEQTEQQYEDLMSVMNNELYDERVLNESAQQLDGELKNIDETVMKEAISRDQLVTVSCSSI